MKKRIQFLISTKSLLILMMMTTLLSGCFNYQRFHKVISGKRTLVYQINAIGRTAGTGFISPADLLGDLERRELNNAVINKFNLTALSVEISPNANNTANSFLIQSIAVRKTGTQSGDIIKDKDYIINKAAASVANTFFVFGGVDRINKVFSEELVGIDPTKAASYIGTGKQVHFDLQGTSVPSTARASITLTLTFDVTIEYSYCEEVPEALFGRGSIGCN